MTAKEFVKIATWVRVPGLGAIAGGCGPTMLQKKTNIKVITMTQPKLSCKLTTPALRARKQTIINELKNNVLEKIDVENGFKYKFNGSDTMVDLLNSFIKTERLCCEFFVFKLTVTSDTSVAWLELTGPEGTKEFITDEIDL